MAKIDDDNIIMSFLVRFALPIAIFIFSVIAKIYTMRKYLKRMTMLECVLESLLCGLGSAITIYVLLKMKLPLWMFCICGGFSSLLVTPITTIITKEASPTLVILVKAGQKIFQNWLNKKS